MALDYLTYYLSGFIWGIFFRDFWFSNTILAYFQIFFFFVFGIGSSTITEFLFWLPLTFIFGLIVGITIPLIIYAPYFIVYEYFIKPWYIAKIIIEIIVLHILLIFWELLPISPFPWGGIVALIVYSVLIFALYWINKYDFIWLVPDGKGCYIIKDCPKIFFFYFAIFFLPVIILFTIIVAVSSIWNFYVGLILFGISMIILIILHFILPSCNY